MSNLDASEQLKIAKRLHFQGDEQEAIRLYQLVLEIEPENEDASSGLRSLGVEPPDPVARRAAYNEAQVKTSFFVNQAKSGHVSPWSTIPFKLVIIALSGVLIFGVYHFGMMLLNFEHIKAAENVDAHIQKVHTLQDGDTAVDIKVSNFNPGPIKNMVVSYNLSDATGNPLKAGSIKLSNTVPPGDSRTFGDISVGMLKQKPDKIEQKLESLVYSKPKNLSPKIAEKFVEATQKPDKETFYDFDEITQDATGFAPALVGMGRAYAAKADYKRAIEQYKLALELDPENANAHYYMGVALFYNHQKPEAKKEIDQAATLAPDDPLIIYSQKYMFAKEQQDHLKTKVKAKSAKDAASDE